MTTMGLEQFRAVTRDGVTFHVDRYGFPVEHCGRCGGSGHYSYCSMYGTKCFDCAGAGVRYAAKLPAAERAAWSNEQRRASRVEAWRMQPGDEVRNYGAKSEPWQTVAAVEVHRDRPCAWTKIGVDGDMTATAWYATVTFDDGTSKTYASHLWSKRARVDPAPYVERAQVAMVAKLRRSSRVRSA